MGGSNTFAMVFVFDEDATVMVTFVDISTLHNSQNSFIKLFFCVVFYLYQIWKQKINLSHTSPNVKTIFSQKKNCVIDGDSAAGPFSSKCCGVVDIYLVGEEAFIGESAFGFLFVFFYEKLKNWQKQWKIIYFKPKPALLLS